MKRIATLVLLAVTVALGAGCEQIDTGNVGVESTWGQVKETALPPGVHFSAFKTIREVSARQNSFALEDLKAKTSDNITMADYDITVYWRINGADAAKIMVKYAGDVTVNSDRDTVVGANLVNRMAREAAYAEMTKYHSSTAHMKRDDIAAGVQKRLQSELDQQMKGAFVVENIAVRSLVTDKSLEESIRAAAKVEFDTRQKTQAKALATAEADRLKIEAEGVARANSIIAASLTPQLLRLREIEAMAGFAKQGNSTVVLPSGATPLIQIK